MPHRVSNDPYRITAETPVFHFPSQRQVERGTAVWGAVNSVMLAISLTCACVSVSLVTTTIAHHWRWSLWLLGLAIAVLVAHIPVHRRWRYWNDMWQEL